MEIVEIEGVFTMDTGSPSPILSASDGDLQVTFFLSEESHKRNENDELLVGQATVSFNRCTKFMFGAPNDETLYGHPYYKLGMRSYGFYELRNSDWIEQLKSIDRIHPRYDDKKWEKFKHYIVTFHDNMLECIAQGYFVSENHVNVSSIVLS